MAASQHIIKTRDDKAPIILNETTAETSSRQFEVMAGCECSWIRPGERFGSEKLRPRIEPWLTALFQSEHLSLLIGSGLTHAVHWMATKKGLPGMGKVVLSAYRDEIATAAGRSAEDAGREAGNFEDQLRVSNELLKGLQILSSSNKEYAQKAKLLEEDLTRILEEFAAFILLGERELITADSADRQKAFNYLVSFLMSFASRTGTRDRLQMFTTNYDRYIEVGAELAGLHLLDRFVGSLSSIFRASRLDVDMHYNPPGIRGEPRYLEGVAKLTKLHGSVDWVYAEKLIRRIGLPFGVKSVEPFLAAPGLEELKALQLMIYPNAAKDRETAAYPYVELFRDFAAAVCRPNNTLIAFGYSFGDEHINRVIEDMLTIPSSHLVVIAHGDPLGRILKMYESLGRHAQVTLMIGDHLGDFQSLVDNYLPKPAIDRTTFRMAELLKSRWGTAQAEGKSLLITSETTSFPSDD